MGRISIQRRAEFIFRGTVVRISMQRLQDFHTEVGKGGQNCHPEVGKISMQRWLRISVQRWAGFHSEVGRIPFRGGQEFYEEVGKISK